MAPRGLAEPMDVALNRQFFAELFLELLQVVMRQFFILFDHQVKMALPRSVVSSRQRTELYTEQLQMGELSAEAALYFALT